jgi:hypothetical protein
LVAQVAYVAANPNSAIPAHSNRYAMNNSEPASGISAITESAVSCVIASVRNAMK